ncbi:hypothetical protein AB1N83_005897 [Pleurotus pulmonarius]
MVHTRCQLNHFSSGVIARIDGSSSNFRVQVTISGIQVIAAQVIMHQFWLTSLHLSKLIGNGGTHPTVTRRSVVHQHSWDSCWPDGIPGPS